MLIPWMRVHLDGDLQRHGDSGSSFGEERTPPPGERLVKAAAAPNARGDGPARSIATLRRGKIGLPDGDPPCSPCSPWDPPGRRPGAAAPSGWKCGHGAALRRRRRHGAFGFPPRVSDRARSRPARSLHLRRDEDARPDALRDTEGPLPAEHGRPRPSRGETAHRAGSGKIRSRPCPATAESRRQAAFGPPARSSRPAGSPRPGSRTPRTRRRARRRR